MKCEHGNRIIISMKIKINRLNKSKLKKTFIYIKYEWCYYKESGENNKILEKFIINNCFAIVLKFLFYFKEIPKSQRKDLGSNSKDWLMNEYLYKSD